MGKVKTDRKLTRIGYYERAHLHRDSLIEKQAGKCFDCENIIEIKNKRKYHIHHIDKDISNNNITNLVILCVSCHSKRHWTDGSRKARTWDGAVKKKFGLSIMQFRDLGITNYKQLEPWDSIKSIPGAVYKGCGFGIVKNQMNIIKYGHSCVEFAKYLGVSRQRAEQLIKKNSPRIAEAKVVLDRGIDKTLPI